MYENDVMNDFQAVGYVVGEVQTDAFTFVTNPELAPPRLEYIVLRGVRERVGDTLRTIDVLAQVASLSVSSRLLSQSMNYSEVESILRRLGASAPVVVGQAKVLGYFDVETRSVRLPRGAAMPGAVVERAPDSLLQQFFSKGVASGLEIGALINRPAVSVRLDPNGLRRHLAVIAQTGAGKSYTVGVVLEQLLQLGGTVVVFDPNSDYVLMGRTPDKRPTPFAERVQVYRVPSEQTSRIPDADIGHVRKLTVQFSNLDVDEICDIAGISEKATNIRLAVRTAHQQLSGDFTADDLYEAVEALAEAGGYGGGGDGEPGARRGDPFAGLPAGWDSVPSAPGENSDRVASDLGTDRGEDGDQGGAGDTDFSSWLDTATDRTARWAKDSRSGASGGAAGGREAGGRPADGRPAKPPSQDAISGAQKAVKYLDYLRRLSIWGFEDVPLEAILRPMSLSAIDLAGVDRKISDFAVAKITSEIWKQATRDGLARPVFLVLEEAHNFVPAGADDGKAGWWLKRIASEGRKFGIFLVLVTQRPYRVHQDTLSQCGSQIIMRLTNPEDQNAVRKASESISESLLGDLPGLNVGEAVILGNLVRVPVMVRIRQRESDEGGSDIDLARALEIARSEAETGRIVAQRSSEQAARGRQPWVEEV